MSESRHERRFNHGRSEVMRALAHTARHPKKRNKEPVNRSDALGAVGVERGHGGGGHVGGGVAGGALRAHRAQTSSAVGAWVPHACSGITAGGKAGAVRARAG